MSFFSDMTESLIANRPKGPVLQRQKRPLQPPPVGHASPSGTRDFLTIASTTPNKPPPTNNPISSGSGSSHAIVYKPYVPLSKKHKAAVTPAAPAAPATPVTKAITTSDAIAKQSSTARRAATCLNDPFSVASEIRPTVAAVDSPLLSGGYMVNKEDCWSENYRPRTLEQFVGNAKAVGHLVNWISNASKHVPGTRPVALITGPPGIGKTTLAHAVMRQFGYEVAEVNASDARSHAAVLKAIRSNACSSMSVTTGKLRGLILDEIDGCVMSDSERQGSGEQGGIHALTSWIRSVQVPNKYNPIICIANDKSHKQMRALADVCFLVPMYAIKEAELQKLMAKLIFHHSLPLTPDQQTQMLASANGDARKLVGLLEWYYVSSTKQQLSTHNVRLLEEKRQQSLFSKSIFSSSRKVKGAPTSTLDRGGGDDTNQIHNPTTGAADNFDSIFDTTGRLLFATPHSFYTKETADLADGLRVPASQYQGDLIIPMVHENYLRAQPPGESDGMLAISDMLSAMDVMETACWSEKGDSSGSGQQTMQDQAEYACVTTVRAYPCDPSLAVDWNNTWDRRRNRINFPCMFAKKTASIERAHTMRKQITERAIEEARTSSPTQTDWTRETSLVGTDRATLLDLATYFQQPSGGGDRRR